MSKAKGLLVFAGKAVGLQAASYLFSIKAPIRRLYAASAADEELIATAKSVGIPINVFTPKVTPNEILASGERFEWILNLWSPHLLNAELLATADHTLNIHPSLVPHCRGNDNAAWTIRLGLPAGVSRIGMTAKLDAGDIYAQRPVPYSFPITGLELHRRLQDEAVALFRDSWPAIYEGRTKPRPQDGTVSYFCRKDTNADRVLDESAQMSVGEFLRWAQAHNFAPGTTAEVIYQSKRYRLQIGLEPIQ